VADTPSLAGLASAIDYLKNLRFTDDDNDYLATLRGNDGQPLFDRAFLSYLGESALQFERRCDPRRHRRLRQRAARARHRAAPAGADRGDGAAEHAEFQTLIATKAARVVEAARGDDVLEFGLRRAQGIDGGLSATRASYIGGCVGTSNVLAGKLFGIPVRGTHAHSWVMSFDSELEAFEEYAKALPNNCVFLVDTYDTLEGVRHAIEVGRRLREGGHELLGIRLDSGDLAFLSIEARKLLDEAGFPKAKILASNDLDEYLIADLKQQGATIAVWGVGTRLVTAYDQPALGGVYKLSALRDESGKWEHTIKLSEQSAKVSIPGMLQVRRYKDAQGQFIADAIYDTLIGIGDRCTIVDPMDITRRKVIEPGTPHEDLLVPIFRDGKLVYDQPPLPKIRQRTIDQLAALHPTTRRFANPHRYPAGLEEKLYNLRNDLIFKARGLMPE
jgi:nicotinate phosphoribosyltransferase